MKPVDQLEDSDHLLNPLFFVALLIFIMIMVFVCVYPENRFDKYIQEQTHPLTSPALLPFWIRMTFFGSFEFLFPAWVIFIFISIWKRKIRYGLSVASLAVFSFLSVQIFKFIIQRHRPPMPLIPNFIDYSFPSGHSASSFVFCAVLTWSLWNSSVSRSLRIAGTILMIVLVFLVGLSRVVLNVHYPTDVAAGFCLGMLWVIAWYRYIKNKI